MAMALSIRIAASNAEQSVQIVHRPLVLADAMVVTDALTVARPNAAADPIPAPLPPRSGRRRMGRRVAEVALVAALGGVAAMAALGPVATVKGTVGPGTVELRATPRLGGGSRLLLPPLGTVAAATHHTPLGVDVRVDEINFERLEHELAGDRPGEQLRRHVDHDLGRLVPRFLVRALIVAAIAGALAGAVLPRRRKRHMVMGGAGAVAITALLLASTATSYRSSAFSHPRFEGSLARIPGAFAAVRRGVEQLGGGRLSGLSDQVADLYAGTAGPSANPTAAAAAVSDEVRILHISDIHSNPIGLEVARQLATGFQVDAVLDTGDLTSFGLPVEAQLSGMLRDFPVPYLFVPGNHDSPDNRKSLGAARNVTLLDGATATVRGVRILGVGDPTFTATGSVSNTEATAARLAHAPEVAGAVARDHPDVLAVHDPVLATDALGQVPLVVSGHLHHRHQSVQFGTRQLVVGSTGATGLGSFTVRTRLPYEAEVLRFIGGQLVAVDYVTMQGVGGNLRVDRELTTP
jgi:predicted phosphodiesterase